MLMLPFFNYADGNHDAIREMLLHPAGVVGLSDGGAHCGMICDASYPDLPAHPLGAGPAPGREAAAGVRRPQADPRHRAAVRSHRPRHHRAGQEGRPQRHRLRRADAASRGGGLRPAGRREPDPAGRHRLRGHDRQRDGDPPRRRRHRRPSRPFGARSALRLRVMPERSPPATRPAPATRTRSALRRRARPWCRPSAITRRRSPRSRSSGCGRRCGSSPAWSTTSPSRATTSSTGAARTGC